MKILFLVSSMGGGGAERVAAILTSAWVARGDDVMLMPTFSGRGGCTYPLSAGVRLEYLADQTGVQGRGAVTYLRRYVALRNTIRNYAPDVIISFLTNVNVAAILAAWGLHVPVIVSERIYPPMLPVGRILSWLRRHIYPRSFSVVAQTEESRQWLEVNCPGARVKTIPNPVVWPLLDREPKKPPSDWISSDRRLLLAVGRLVPQKNFGHLIEVFGQLAREHPDWDLVLAGEGPELEALKGTIDRAELSGRVRLPGLIGNIGAWYERADLYVMTSLFEGFPNSLAEAMACGVAVVSLDCHTGPRDLIRHEYDGLLVSSGDAGALVRELGRMMGDDELRGRLALHAPEVRQRFSQQRIASLWDEVMNASIL